MRGSYYYTRILLLYKDPTIIQGSYYYTRILLLYKDIVFLVIWSQEKDWEVLGPPREAEIRYASIWIGGEAWRGR